MKPKIRKPITQTTYPGSLFNPNQFNQNPPNFKQNCLFLKSTNLSIDQLEIHFRKFNIKRVINLKLKEYNHIQYVLEFESFIDVERVFTLFNQSYVPELESFLELSPDITNFSLFTTNRTKYVKLSNILPNVTPLKLYHEFRSVGPIINIITGQTHTNKNCGPCYIQYLSEELGSKAIKVKNRKKFFKSIIHIAFYTDLLTSKIILTQHDRSNSSSLLNSPTELRSPIELPTDLPFNDSKNTKKSNKKNAKQTNKVRQLLEAAKGSESITESNLSYSPKSSRPESTSPIHDIIKSVKFQLPQSVTVSKPSSNGQTDQVSDSLPPVLKRPIPGRLGHLRSKSYSYHAQMDHTPADFNSELPAMNSILNNQQKFVNQYLQSKNIPTNEQAQVPNHHVRTPSTTYQQDLLVSHRKNMSMGFHAHSRHASLQAPMLNRQSFESRTNQQQHLKGHLYVSNLPTSIDEPALTQLFQPFGELTSVRVIKNELGQPKGYGFVQFQNLSDAVQSMESLNQTNILGNILHVEFAASKSQKQAKLISQQTNMHYYFEKFNFSNSIELPHIPKESVSQLVYQVIRLNCVHQAKLEAVVSNLLEFYNNEIDSLLSDEEYLKEKVSECYQLANIRSKKLQPSVKLLQNINLVQQRISRSDPQQGQEEIGIKLYELISCMNLTHPVDVCLALMDATQSFVDLIHCMQFQTKELMDLCKFLDQQFPKQD